ncbi:probable E3 ubiquitin-protein ligase LUL4 [Cajanus cajan]|nr:probable E3 ubiquitin-protein ligase LUL4 [Cajanus cajan]
MRNPWNSNIIRRRNIHFHPPYPYPCYCLSPPQPQPTTNPPLLLHRRWPYATGIPVLPPPNANAPKNINNTVNLHKHTLTLQLDPNNPHHHLISFHFDALYDGSFTIFYMAKEEGCMFSPLFPEVFEPITFTFEKGVGQKFCQPSGTGIDLGFFELDDLSRSFSPEDDEFPLVICAEISSNYALDATPHMQITQAILEKSNDIGPFNVKVVRQLLWINNVCYELKELYGTATDFDDDNDSEEECVCVICMMEPKDTAILPCRHMCMCSECAKTLQSQSNKCPICRQPIQELIEIKINNNNQ